MALLHAQPDLRQIPQKDFESLARVVSRIAVKVEALDGKLGGFDWPEQFTQSPQKLLNQD